jgi:hypothetical protein
MNRYLACLLSLIATWAVICVRGAAGENRSFDGSANNLDPLKSNWGAAGTQLIRKAEAAYDDGYASPAGVGRLSAREISNSALSQTAMVPNTHLMTDWVFQWGQFIDHDLDLTVLADPSEPFHIPIPMGDPIFDPMSTGMQIMPFTRSQYDPATGTGPGNPRQQINAITSYIDGSMVYGSDQGRADTLRTMSGGRLKTSAGNLLPLNTFGLPNGTGNPLADPTQFYVAGDVRANEQVGLTAIHTLMVREHNRLADEIAATNPLWSDDDIYQRARKLIGAEIQVITYNEFLPALLGPHAPGVNSVYDENVDASVATEFSTALFRVGHTMLSPQLMRMNNDGTVADGGHMALRDAFFLPQSLAADGELECFLKGLASDQQQEVDMHVVDDVRNFLFGEPIPGGFDLPALNIQRGRDHGLPDYNTIRAAYGLAPANAIDDITSNPEAQAALEALYCDAGVCDLSDIDVWVAALAEDHLPGAAVGELITVGLVDQFTRARDGDRFWYRNDPNLSPDDIAWLESIQLSDLIRWNTSITNLQPNVFFMVPEPSAIGILIVAVMMLGGGRRKLNSPMQL